MTTVSERVRERKARFGGRTRILVVENEEAIREVILEMLEGQQVELLSAKDGVEGVELARREERKIDLLLTEAEPQGMRGQDLAQSLYTLHPGIKIVFMSGKFDEGFAHMLGEQARRMFLLKPFTRKMLLEKIADVLG
jgi:two-component system, cell cycle sensor histidine kinase and response regulator CckA